MDLKNHYWIEVIGGICDGNIFVIAARPFHGAMYTKHYNGKTFAYVYHYQLDRYIYEPHFHPIVDSLFEIVKNR